MTKLVLSQTKRTHPIILKNMENHYSQPKGFVGRNICYLIYYNFECYGSIVGGSSTRFLPGRDEFFNFYSDNWSLNNIVNNIFFHHYKINDRYPLRNFSQKVLEEFKLVIVRDWNERYGDKVIGLETLVELPRTGELYLRNGWTHTGVTKGYTCKRIAGKGTDNWSGKRVWDTQNLRPKNVFCYKL